MTIIIYVLRNNNIHYLKLPDNFSVVFCTEKNVHSIQLWKTFICERYGFLDKRLLISVMGTNLLKLKVQSVIAMYL
jgi:hypothetical protein